MSTGFSVFSGAMVITASMFGGGILKLPSAFLHAGLVPGVVLFIISAYITGVSLISICAITKKTGMSSFFDVCKAVHPNVGRFVDVAVAMECALSACIYVCFMQTWLTQLFPGVNRYLIVGVVGSITYALSCQRSLERLKFLGALSIAAFLYLLVLVVVFAVALPSMNAKTESFGKHVASGISPILFSFGCQHSMVSVFVGMRNKTSRAYTLLVVLAISSGLMLFLCMGMIPYVKFGTFCKYDIIEILTSETEGVFSEISALGKVYAALARVAVISFCMLLTGSYCFLVLPARTSLHNMVCTVLNITNREMHELHIRLALTALFTALAIALALSKITVDAIMDVATMVGYVPAFFIVPGIAYAMLHRKKNAKWHMCVANSIIGTGISIWLCKNFIQERI